MLRRAFLLASASFGLAPGEARAAGQPVSVLYAGSLVTAFERDFFPFAAEHGVDVQGEAKGSVALANLIESGLRTPDVFVSADALAIEPLMSAAHGALVAWYATFATTRLVIGYAPKSPFAATFAEVAKGALRLDAALQAPDLHLGRTDPALDPKGYRTLIAMELFGRLRGDAGLARKVLGEPRNPKQIVPEEALLARLESGDLDAAFLYSTESAARRLPSVELPPEANLGDPALAATYAEVSVTVEGKRHAGAPIVYALTIPKAAPNAGGANALVRLMFGAEGRRVLEGAGLHLVRPAVRGDASAVPASLREALGVRR